MRDETQRRIDWTALSLMIVGIAVGVSVVSNALGHGDGNLTGYPGAKVASSLFVAMGRTTFLLVAAWLVLTASLIRKPMSWSWGRKLAGWLTLLMAVAVTESWLAPSTDGNVGAWLRVWMSTKLGATAAIVAVCGLFALATFLLIERALPTTWHLSVRGVGIVPKLFRRATAAKPRIAVRERIVKPRKARVTEETAPVAHTEHELPSLSHLY